MYTHSTEIIQWMTLSTLQMTFLYFDTQTLDDINDWATDILIQKIGNRQLTIYCVPGEIHLQCNCTRHNKQVLLVWISTSYVSKGSVCNSFAGWNKHVFTSSRWSITMETPTASREFSLNFHQTWWSRPHLIISQIHMYSRVMAIELSKFYQISQ